MRFKVVHLRDVGPSHMVIAWSDSRPSTEGVCLYANQYGLAAARASWPSLWDLRPKRELITTWQRCWGLIEDVRRPL